MNPLLSKRFAVVIYDSVVSLKHGYRQTSNVRHILLGNRNVDHSDVVKKLPVEAAPTTFSFST